jgi:hypothetical protein
MFDNHLVALDFAISDGWELSEHTPLDLHRLLTKNIDFFENILIQNNIEYQHLEKIEPGIEDCFMELMLSKQ